MRSTAWPETVVAALAACSLEAAWITLLYVTVEGLATRALAPLPILAFGGAALLGLAVVRWMARHGHRDDRTWLAGLAVVIALIGWLLPLGPAAAHAIDAPMTVLGMHPGGILLGLAVLRGTAHVSADDDERIAETALGPGLFAVAATWLVLTASGSTRDPAIVAVAFSATVTFVTAGLLSIGLARLAGLRSAGVVGAGRRSWVGLVVGVVAGLLVVALPLALVVGVPLDSAIRGVLGPLGDVLVPIATLLLWPAGLLAALLVVLVGLLRGGSGIVSDPGGALGPPGFDWGNPVGSSGSQGLVLGLVPIVIAIVVAVLVLRRFVQRPELTAVERDVVEIREIEPPSSGVRIRRPHLPIPRRGETPGTASEAYLASLSILAEQPDSARLSTETPLEHARRLTADPIRSLLGRLAADYVLAEFAGRTLTPAEHRRAVERWRRLRSLAGRSRS